MPRSPYSWRRGDWWAPVARKLPLRLQAFYTFTELAQRTGTSAKRVRNVLDHARISPRRLGGQYLVFVSEIEGGLPELWLSIVACERLRAMNRALREPDDLTAD